MEYGLVYYLHTVHSSTIACNGGNVIVGLFGNWESSWGFETGERGNQVSLCRGGTVNGGDCGRGNQGHFSSSTKLLSSPSAQLLLLLIDASAQTCYISNGEIHIWLFMFE